MVLFCLAIHLEENMAFPSQTRYKKNFQMDKAPALNVKINKTLGKLFI